MHKRVAIIGSGFSGLGLAIRLLQSGEQDFMVFERAATLGGTWRDNDYPGCCCDIPSHVYSFSFELNPDWSRGFATHDEIRDYLQRTAEKYGVLPYLRFEHEVLEAAWDEAAQVWEIETSAGSFTADVLVNAAGALSDPSIPDLPGLETFEGRTFHSARWDHAHDLTGERVAVIGTGASAIQFVPAIQPKVARIDVYQRTPPWIVPRLDHEITRWEKFLLRNVPGLPRLVRTVLYWTLEVRVAGFRRPRVMKWAERVARWHLKRQVPDPELRAKLTPDYTLGCKRILVSDDYLPALNEANVHLVTDGVLEIRKGSVVAGDGTERDVDTIIFGTGFHVIDAPIAERIRGRGGVTLAEHWKNGMRGYKGLTVSGFPNLFYMLGPNTGLGHNSIVFMIESQINYVVDALKEMRRRGVDVFEVREDAELAYDARVQREMKGTVWTSGNCNSWYLDDTGRNPTLWPGWTPRYRRITRRFDPDAYRLGSRVGVLQPATTTTGGLDVT